MKFKNPYKKRAFLKGWGIRKVLKMIQKAKDQIKLFIHRDKRKVLIHKLRIEMYQIKKHQLLTMRYLNDLENLLK
jgi:hypothetical protein